MSSFSTDLSILKKFRLSDSPEILLTLSPEVKKYVIDVCKHILNYLASVSEYKKALLVLKVLEPFDIRCIPSSDLVNIQPTQKGIIEYFQYVNSLLVCMPTGSGKTIISLVVSMCHLRRYPEDNIIVISPKSVLNNFSKEAKKFKLPYDKQKYRNYTYDSFITMYKKNQLIDTTDSLIIIDEAHELRNFQGVKYSIIMKIVKQCRKILLLTATPVINTIVDYISLINLLYKGYVVGPNNMSKLLKGKKQTETETEEDQPKQPPDIYLANPPYKLKVSTSRQTEVRMSIETKNIPIVKSLLTGHVVFRKKDMNSPNLPKVIMHNEYVRMSRSYHNKYVMVLLIYGGVKESKLSNLVFADPIKFYNGYRRAVNKIGVQDGYYSTKMEHIIKIIKGTKSIIYSNWIEYGSSLLSNILKQAGISNKQITGSVTTGERNKIVSQYNEDKIECLIITEAGAEGIDLKGVRKVIIIDPPWSPSKLEQIIGRAVRYKSHEHLPMEQRVVDVYLMQLVEPDVRIEDLYTLNESISGDVILYKIINRKKEIISKSDEMLEEISVV